MLDEADDSIRHEPRQPSLQAYETVRRLRISAARYLAGRVRAEGHRVSALDGRLRVESMFVSRNMGSMQVLPGGTPGVLDDPGQRILTGDLKVSQVWIAVGVELEGH